MTALILIAWLTGIVAESFSLSLPWYSAAAQTGFEYPKVQNITVNVNQGESSTILVPLDNLGSPLNWTGLRLSNLSPPNGIKISTDPLLFVDGFVQANSDNYSLQIGISIGKNVSTGSYTIPFTLTARSSILPPYTTTSITFNMIIIVSRSPPVPFPMFIFYLAVIFISAMTMIGIVLIWSRDWNISEVKK